MESALRNSLLPGYNTAIIRGQKCRHVVFLSVYQFAEYKFDYVAIQVFDSCVENRAVPITVARGATWVCS